MGTSPAAGQVHTAHACLSGKRNEARALRLPAVLPLKAGQSQCGLTLRRAVVQARQRGTAHQLLPARAAHGEKVRRKAVAVGNRCLLYTSYQPV